MSRTDRHRPWGVQLADPYEKRWYRVSYGHEVTWYSLYRFGCPRASHCGGWWVAAERRRIRYAGQRMVRAALKGDWEACD